MRQNADEIAIPAPSFSLLFLLAAVSVTRYVAACKSIFATRAHAASFRVRGGGGGGALKGKRVRWVNYEGGGGGVVGNTGACFPG